MKLQHSGRIRGRAGRRIALCLSTILATGLAVPALAQGQPPHREIDNSIYDMTSGKVVYTLKEGSIGTDESGIDLYRYWVDNAGWSDNWGGALVRYNVGTGAYVYANFGTTSEQFVQSGTNYGAIKLNRVTLAERPDGSYLFTGADGSTVEYSIEAAARSPLAMNCPVDVFDNCYLPTAYTRADGTRFTLDWEEGMGMTYRLSSVTSNTGYKLSFTYVGNDPGFSTGIPPSDEWFTRATAVFTNERVSCGADCPTVSYAYPDLYTTQITNPAGGTWTFGAAGMIQLASIRRPGDASDAVTITHIGNLTTVSTPAGDWKYQNSLSGNTRTVVATDPANQTRTVVSHAIYAQATSRTDELGRTTSYTLNSYGDPLKTISPEGDYIENRYTARLNPVEVKRVGKGPSAPTRSTLASFVAVCGNYKTCNKPVTVTDARGGVTDYSYDPNHGGQLSVKQPAQPNGVRPETRYSYTNFSGVWRLTGISACRTGTTCAGTTDEVKTTIGYDVNLQPTTSAVAAGDNSIVATTTKTYDAIGNVIAVDGPIAGTGDITRMHYDKARRIDALMQPDPDGAGSLGIAAERYTYDGVDHRLTAEIGTVPSQATDWSGFTAAQTLQTVYDAGGRPVRDTLVAAGTIQKLTERSFDAHGRPECVATRMNPANYASTTDACTLTTAGTDGPDRIVRTTYDAAGQATTVSSAYGTPDQVDEVRSFSPNGMIKSEADGKGNTTVYTRDAYDRIAQISYPNPSGAGTSTADYETFDYDANDNVLSHRLRDGRSVAMTYDALDRQTSLDLPASSDATDADVSFTYTNLGEPLLAIDTNGHKAEFSYDALGRKRTEQNSWLAKTSEYDLAGRRTRLTWPDGLFVTYDYLANGAVSAVKENGTNVIATFGYDALGRRTSRTLGNGATTSYSYDPASRISGFDLTGTSATNAYGLSWNPANQLSSRSSANDAFAWTAHANQSEGYTVNGLNQVTQAGAVTPGYDALGNLTSLGTSSWSYNSKNQLSHANGYMLYYDPLGRLDQLDQAGLAFDWDGGDLATELSGGTIVRRHVHGLRGELLLTYESAGTSNRRWLDADERGSIVRQSDDAGNASINRYDVFGAPQSGNLGRFQFAGQIWVPELQLYLMGARAYAPGLGRFLQTDPARYGDGLNWYLYGGNDPVGHRDPSGTDGEQVVVDPVPIVVTGTKIKESGGFDSDLFGGRDEGNDGEFVRPQAKLQDQTKYVSRGSLKIDKSCNGVAAVRDPAVQARMLEAMSRSRNAQKENPNNPLYLEYGFTGGSYWFGGFSMSDTVPGTQSTWHKDPRGFSFYEGRWSDNFTFHTHPGADQKGDFSTGDVKDHHDGVVDIVMDHQNVVRCMK